MTHRFEELDLQVDVIGTTVVAVLRFIIRYELGGSTYTKRRARHSSAGGPHGRELENCVAVTDHRRGEGGGIAPQSKPTDRQTVSALLHDLVIP